MHPSSPNAKRPPGKRIRPLGAAVAALLVSAAAAGGDAQPLGWDLVVCADPLARPFSHNDQSGYENRIAEILAEELGANLRFHWVLQERTLMSDALRRGDCDMIAGVAEGAGAAITTLTYLRSPYVFVYRADEDYAITTFDDVILLDLRIGVKPVDSPAHHALLRRGLSPNIVPEEEYEGDGSFEDDPLLPIINAVVSGEIDVAVTWGPAAGYHARRFPGVVVSPVPPFEPPLVQMYINVAIGVRLGDEALRDELDIAIVNRWEDIQMVLETYGIPRMPLLRPALTIDPS